MQNLADKTRRLTEPYFLKNFGCSLDSSAHSIFLRESVQSDRYGKIKKGARENASYSYFETEGFKKFLDDYIEYLHENKQYLDFYVTVDAIGANDISANKTWEILKYMESFGLNPIPVYHFKEDHKFLKRMIDNYEYIGIGGLGQDITKEKYIPEADKFFKYVCDDNGKPRVKVHGFALTSSELILRYPWYSVDSSTWTYAARSGAIMQPKPIIKNGEILEWDYSSVPTQLSVSDRRSEKDTSHYSNRVQKHRKAIDHYLDTFGVTYKQVSEHYHYRDIVNASYMNRLEELSKKTYPERFGTEGIKLYLAGTPSGTGTNLYRIVNLIHDLNLDCPRFLGAIEYKKMMECILDLKKACLNGTNLQELQIEKIKPEKPVVTQRKTLKRKSKKIKHLKFEIKISYDFSYSLNGENFEGLTDDQILEKELEHLKQNLQNLLNSQKPKIDLKLG